MCSSSAGEAEPLSQPGQGSNPGCLVGDGRLPSDHRPGSPPTAEAIEELFDELFATSEATRLRGGATEPLYEPASGNADALIHYRSDYLSSALHEVAHWCIAGVERRRQVDYGYWYQPDGREALEQARFMTVEARPQALEWLFSEACGVSFRPSLDNLRGEPDPDQERAFADAIAAARDAYLEAGLPARAARFREALRQRFGSVPWQRDSEPRGDRESP